MFCEVVGEIEFSWGPEVVELFMVDAVFIIHQYRMLNDFDSFCCNLESRMPLAVLLSASRGDPMVGCR